MIKTKCVAAILCVVSFLLLPGCQREGEQDKSTDANEEIVCPKLYQKNDSLIDALKFIDTSEDRMETSLSFVSKRGKLADKHQLVFANKLFSIRKSKDVDMFISLLSDGTKKQLNDDNNKQMVHHIRKIKDGTFLYGEYDCKFFATFSELTEKYRDTLKKHVSFAETPSHAVHYWLFPIPRPGYSLIGTTFYLIEDEGSYKIVTQTLLHGEITPTAKKQKASGPKEYGIIAFEQTDDAYTKLNVWKYRWDIELSLDESEDNAFEILKLTKVISGQDDTGLHPDIAKQVLTEESMFEKYRYKELKFTFRIGTSAPADRFEKYGERLTGWIYGFSIASIFRSEFIFFPGKNIMDVRVNKQGNFVGCDLELISFETAKENVRYKHKVILRKKPIISRADL